MVTAAEDHQEGFKTGFGALYRRLQEEVIRKSRAAVVESEAALPDQAETVCSKSCVFDPFLLFTTQNPLSVCLCVVDCISGFQVSGTTGREYQVWGRDPKALFFELTRHRRSFSQCCLSSLP